jgi:hypothetical protein
MKKIKAPNQKGIAIAIVMMILAAITLSSSAMYYLGSNFNQISVKTKYRQQVQYAAETGMQDAITWLNSTATINGHQMVNNIESQTLDRDAITDTDLLSCLGLMNLTTDRYHYTSNRTDSLTQMISGDTRLEDFEYFYTVQRFAKEYSALVSLNATTNWTNFTDATAPDGSAAIYSTDGFYLSENFFDTNTDTFSIELWIALTDASDDHIIELVDDLGNRKLLMERAIGDEIRTTINNGADAVTFTTSGWNFGTDDLVKHVVLTWQEGVGANVYLNHTEDVAMVQSFTNTNVQNAEIPDGDTRVIIGNGGNAIVQGFRFWNILLTEAQIENVQTSYLNNNTNLLMAYYFDRRNSTEDTITSHVNATRCEGNVCQLSYDDTRVEMNSIKNSESLRGTSVFPPPNMPIVVPHSSIFRILSCGVGPQETYTGLEKFISFDGINSISTNDIGERFL